MVVARGGVRPPNRLSTSRPRPRPPRFAADCPPRKAEPWEHEPRRTNMLANYNKYSLRCPHVSLLLFPFRLQVVSP